MALGRAPVYKKFAIVKARRAAVGEQIATVLKSGVVETVNTANDCDWIVTNPSGETFILPEKKFFARYEATKEVGVYAAKGCCKAIKNPFGYPIEILASWGSPQTGDTNCLIADVCNEDGSNLEGEPYIIEDTAFEETYRPVQV